MSNVIIATFVLGYIFIALENATKVSKAGVALFMSVLCWGAYMLAADGYVSNFYQQAFTDYLQHDAGASAIGFIADKVFSRHVAETCETILFLMGAMTIVEVVDSNGGFNFVTRRLRTSNSTSLLWKTVVLTFFLSALLDNMTTCIVMVMVLKKLVADKQARVFYAGIVIIAANAGGAFSPIGDVTTIMLWIKGCVSTTGIIKGLFLPSLISVVIPTLIMTPMLKKYTLIPAVQTSHLHADKNPGFPRKARVSIFCIGVFGLMLVPVFRSVTGLPPFVGVMGVLAILWITTEIMIRHNKRLLKIENEVRVSNIIKKIDMSTILFFLGILLTVGALQETGTLNAFGLWLNDAFGSVYIVNTLIGVMSSIVDNVPLVASAMGMYNIEPAGTIGTMQAYCQDGIFWELLAYCAGTGGSMLIIGSAAGVVVMGLENISFGWYLKRFTWIAFVGYISGIIAYWLQSMI
jgi:Na+/H+ antiporter NhaD/arsenite permease-like protein